MGWLIALLVLIMLALLLLMRVGISVKLCDDTLLTLGVGIFRIKLFPRREKKLRLSDYKIDKHRRRLEKEEKKKKKKAAKKAEKKQSEKKSGKVLSEKTEPKEKRDISELIEAVVEIVRVFFERFGRHLHIKLRRLNITVASPDAASTAVLYGAVCGAVQCLLELLYNSVTLTLPKNEEITVTPDFTSEKTRADVDITFSLRLWQVIDILFRSVWAYIKTK